MTAQGWLQFDFYYGAPFWGAFAAVAAIVRLTGARGRAREAILLVASTLMLLALPRFELRDLALVLGVCAATFAVAAALCRDPGSAVGTGRRRALAVAGVTAVLGFLCFFKYRFVQGALLDPRSAEGGAPAYLFLIGASYFAFKAIHVIVDAYRRSLKRVDALHYVTYMCFFPSFISGPINRYEPFAAEVGADVRGRGAEDLALGAERIVHGLFKKVVLVAVVAPYLVTDRASPLGGPTLAGVAGGLVATALYFYFDFSAYSDLAIGAARVLGIGLPENFERPFLRRNIRELWSSWHMSLTAWLIDYVYWPVVRRLRSLEFFRARPVLLSIVGMNVTFLACGAWHGEAANFLLWGAYHGVGISILNLYQRQKKRWRSPQLQRWFASRASRALGAAGTFCFFTLGIALFVLDVDRLRAVAVALVH